MKQCCELLISEGFLLVEDSQLNEESDCRKTLVYSSFSNELLFTFYVSTSKTFVSDPDFGIKIQHSVVHDCFSSVSAASDLLDLAKEVEEKRRVYFAQQLIEIVNELTKIAQEGERND